MHWAPVTKTGVLEFHQNCLGQGISSKPIKPKIVRNTCLEKLDYMNNPITWQPIKPGETAYLVKNFFRQANPVNMTLEEMIEFCKGIDWGCVDPIPPNIPKAVKSTMEAVNEMWLEYRTDNPEEVQWWLADG